LTNTFQSVIRDEPIFVSELELKESMLGNRLGHYFETLACAQIAGLHLIFIEFTPSKDILFNVSMVIRHPQPANSRDEAITMVQRHCNSGQTFPWSQADSILYKNISIIKSHFENILQLILNLKHNQTNIQDLPSNFLSSNTFSTVVQNQIPLDIPSLPFLPSVSILLRCSDVLSHHGTSPYGFVNWHNYLSLIPRNSSHVYIHSEPLNYKGSEQSAHFCNNLTQELVFFISRHFRKSVIAVRRGFALDGLVQLSLANLTICSPSTFCLFPALYQQHSVAFQLSSLIANGNASVTFTSTWKWIEYPPLQQFGEYDLSTSNAFNDVMTLLTSPHPATVPNNLTYLHPDGTLIQISGTRTIYLLDQRKLRPFQSKDAFLKRGFSFESVVNMQYPQWPVGDPLY